MKIKPSRPAKSAFTLMEAVLVVVIVGILLIFLLPGTSNRPVNMPISSCRENLAEIGMQWKIFADDNGGKFPPQLSTNDGGSMEFISTGHASPHFQTITFALGGRPFVCPADKPKWSFAAGNRFGEVDDRANQSSPPITLDERGVSYFISVDAKVSDPNVILAGDRNLEVNGRTVPPGLFTLRTNDSAIWTRAVHLYKGQPLGNIVLADGHAETIWTNSDLMKWVRRQRLPANRVAVP